MKKEEAHIIKEILNGKTEQYEYFLDRYGQQVFVLVDRIVSCQEDAEELTQDVFLKAFQQLSSFKAESSFSTWIYRIATNIAISAVRKKRNDVLRLDDSVLPTFLIQKWMQHWKTKAKNRWSVCNKR